MKKLSVAALSIMFICLSTAADAQQTAIYKDTRTHMLLGVKAGVNASNVWDEAGNDFRANTKAGFVGGGFMSLPLGMYLGIQPEVLYSKKGFKGSGTMLGMPYSFSRTTTYLDVPVLVQVKPAPYMTLLAGPQYSYLLRQKDEFTSPIRNTEQEQEFKNDNIRKNVMGAVIGADVIIAPMVISGRAGWDMQNNNGDGSSSVPRYKNQWVQLTLGFQL
jgi:hypothetical protein